MSTPPMPKTERPPVETSAQGQPEGGPKDSCGCALEIRTPKPKERWLLLFDQISAHTLLPLGVSMAAASRTMRAMLREGGISVEYPDRSK